MKDIPVICLSLSRHDSAISSPALSLAKEISKQRQVYYIDHPFSWKDVVKERRSPAVKKRLAALFNLRPGEFSPWKDLKNFRVIIPPATIPVNFLPPSELYNFLSRQNDRKLFAAIRNLIKRENIRQFIFINFFDPFFCAEFPKDIRPLLYVYQSMDDIAEEAYTARHGVRLEDRIIRRADITLCTSLELTRIHRPKSAHVYYHPNAADSKIFNQAVTDRLMVPEPISHISGKIIGFTGSLDYRTDIALLEKIAQEFHTETVCFVGPVLSSFDRGRLAQYPNLLFYPPVAIEALPAYLQRFSAAIIPYNCNKLSRSIYPLKLNEYLAAGKPVVCTDFSEDLHGFREFIYLSKTHDDFTENLRRALNENDPVLQNARVQAAAENTWEQRVADFWKIVEKRLTAC